MIFKCLNSWYLISSYMTSEHDYDIRIYSRDIGLWTCSRITELPSHKSHMTVFKIVLWRRDFFFSYLQNVRPFVSMHYGWSLLIMMTSSDENIFRVTGPLSPVTGEFPAQRPVTRNFDVFFDLRLNKRFGKHLWRQWFETSSRSLIRKSCPLCSVYSSEWILFIFGTIDHYN